MRPWRRETMHSLVKDATGVDFHEFGNNAEAAKEAARAIFKARSEGKDNSSSLVEACSSVGHVLNEVKVQGLHISYYSCLE